MLGFQHIEAQLNGLFAEESEMDRLKLQQQKSSHKKSLGLNTLDLLDDTNRQTNQQTNLTQKRNQLCEQCLIHYREQKSMNSSIYIKSHFILENAVYKL